MQGAPPSPWLVGWYLYCKRVVLGDWVIGFLSACCIALFWRLPAAADCTICCRLLADHPDATFGTCWVFNVAG
jgi:hypothetical protein